MWKFGLKNKKCLTKLIIECDVRVVMFFDWYVWMWKKKRKKKNCMSLVLFASEEKVLFASEEKRRTTYLYLCPCNHKKVQVCNFWQWSQSCKIIISIGKTGVDSMHFLFYFFTLYFLFPRNLGRQGSVAPNWQFFPLTQPILFLFCGYIGFVWYKIKFIQSLL